MDSRPPVEKKHLPKQVLFLELLPRFELGTSSLPIILRVLLPVVTFRMLLPPNAHAARVCGKFLLSLAVSYHMFLHSIFSYMLRLLLRLAQRSCRLTSSLFQPQKAMLESFQYVYVLWQNFQRI